MLTDRQLLLVIGAVFVVAGWYGPEDGGALAAIGLTAMAWALLMENQR